MVLALDDIALFLANWQPKDEGLRALAAGLNIATDSLVFVDDNPSERSWIRRQLPEVEVPEMPRDPALFIHALQRPLYFEALRLTEDDRRRTDSYRANLERQHTEAGSASVDDFLRGLQMRVSLAPFDELNLPRITQLINKTNQFNLTTRRFSEEQVRGFMQRSGCYTQSMRLVDRFGDNGLTGILIGVREQDHLRIDTWLISCRVLGRRVEDAMLTAACNYAFAAGARRILGEYLPTAKNQQVMDLYDRFGFARIDQWPAGEKRYALPLSEVRPFPPWYEVNDGTQHAVSNTAGAASAS